MSRTFKASEFTPTEFDTANDKAKFANHFFRFLEKGCPESLFHKWFYTRLSNTFGHIAHYNQGGFYDVWFSTPEKQLEFIRHTIQQPVYGSPTCTYSDVEKLIKVCLVVSQIPDKIATKAKKPLVHEDAGKSTTFVVCRRSDNLNSFGLRGYWLVNKAGQVYEACNSVDLPLWKTVHLVTDSSGRLNWGCFECPTPKKDAPQNVVDEVFKKAFESAWNKDAPAFVG